MEKERNISIDILKGIGIIFVIIGHIALDYKQQNLFTYIYSFHMPLFFFISGYLAYGKRKKKINVLIKQSFIKLMIPYYFFLLISIFFTETVVSFGDHGGLFLYKINLKNLFLAFLLGGGYLDKIPCLNFALWYLPLYFVAKICFELIIYNEKIRTKLLPFIIILLIIITIPFQNLLPGRPFLHINILPPALVFMGIGYLFKKYEEKDSKSNICSIFALIIGIIIAYINGGNISEIKNIIYFIGAICSIYFWYHIAKQSNNKVLQYIGRGSIIIYPIHLLISTSYKYTNIDKILALKWENDIMFLIIKLIYIVIISGLLYKLYIKMKRNVKYLWQTSRKRKI